MFRDRSMAENEIWNGVSLKRGERRGGKILEVRRANENGWSAKNLKKEK